MPAPDKVQEVEELKEKLGRSKSVVVADFRGLTVAQINDLRRRARASAVDYRVVKNRLLKRALSDCGMNTLDEILKGPTAVAIGFDDPVSPAKVLHAFSKENDKLKIKGGLLGPDGLTEAAVKELATLPGREELLARLMGSLNSPVTKLAIGLNQAVAKVAYALKAVADQKSAA